MTRPRRRATASVAQDVQGPGLHRARRRPPRAPAPRAGSRVSRTVVLLGLTSLFTDISSEMVATVLPLYLVSLPASRRSSSAWWTGSTAAWPRSSASSAASSPTAGGATRRSRGRLRPVGARASSACVAGGGAAPRSAPLVLARPHRQGHPHRAARRADLAQPRRRSSAPRSACTARWTRPGRCSARSSRSPCWRSPRRLRLGLRRQLPASPSLGLGVICCCSCRTAARRARRGAGRQAERCATALGLLAHPRFRGARRRRRDARPGDDQRRVPLPGSAAPHRPRPTRSSRCSSSAARSPTCCSRCRSGGSPTASAAARLPRRPRAAARRSTPSLLLPTGRRRRARGCLVAVRRLLRRDRRRARRARRRRAARGGARHRPRRVAPRRASRASSARSASAPSGRSPGLQTAVLAGAHRARPRDRASARRCSRGSRPGSLVDRRTAPSRRCWSACAAGAGVTVALAVAGNPEPVAAQRAPGGGARAPHRRSRTSSSARSTAARGPRATARWPSRQGDRRVRGAALSVRARLRGRERRASASRAAVADRRSYEAASSAPTCACATRSSWPASRAGRACSSDGRYGASTTFVSGALLRQAGRVLDPDDALRHAPRQADRATSRSSRSRTAAAASTRPTSTSGASRSPPTTHRFYATLATGGQTYLVEGSVRGAPGAC